MSWLRGLKPRFRESDVSPASGNGARPPAALPAPHPLVVRAAVNGRASGQTTLYGLNACGYTPVAGGAGRLFVLCVASLLNAGTEDILLRRPHLALDLGGGARKVVAAATVVALERLSFFDGGAGGRPIPEAEAELRARLAGPASLHRSALILSPRTPVLAYATFLPQDVGPLPVFNGDFLNFGLAFGAGGGRHTYYGFRARPFPRLTVTFT